MIEVKCVSQSKYEKYPISIRKRLGGEELLEALARDKQSQEVMDALWLAAQSWLGCGGQISMNRFLGLPTTTARLNRANRDMWLRKAAQMIELDSQFLKAGVLHKELIKFATRGAWQAWRNLSVPPKEASELRYVLFFILKFSSGKVITERQIYAIIR